MRNVPSILLAVALAAPTFAEEFDVLFDQPQLDRWMYPFNSSAGARATMSVFGSDREVPTQFDARDGQILLAFDTDLVIPPGGTAAGYRVTSAEVTMQVQNNLVFRYDPTPDAWTTFLPATDTRRTVDADEGQPVELFGVGFRGGYSAATFAEDTAFTGSGSFLSPGVRNAFAAVVDAAGIPSDVSNNPRVGFQPKNFATGSITGLAPGALVPGDSIMRFAVDVSDPGIQAYLCQGVHAGRVFFAASALTIVQQQAGAFPVFYAKENAFVSLGLAQAARLRIKVETVPACAPEDLDCNGVVDFGDVALALIDFGPCTGCQADLDGTGIVDYGDVALVMLSYG
jgi:hypothetical protein